MSAAEIARALGGHANGGGWLVSCPLPSHGKGRGDRNPSLSVRDGEKAELAVHCFGGCTGRDILAELRRLGLMDAPHDRVPVPYRPPSRAPSFEASAAALTIWREARPNGGVVAAYLRGRKITAEAPPTIRQGVSLVYGGTSLPTLVAAVQAPDRRIVAVQELRLTCGGRKAPVRVQRKTTGAIAGSAVRLGPAGDVLGLAEGVETGLSAQEISGISVWCGLGAENLANVVIPDTVRNLIIFADNDEAGQRGAMRAAERWVSRGVRAEIRTPVEVSDWNDELRRQAGVAL